MKRTFILFNSVFGSAVLVLVAATGTLIYLMFSTGEGEFGRKEGLFGSVFFDAEDKGEGITGATMGIADPTALVIIFTLILVVLAFFQIALYRLKSYRAQIIAERAKTEHPNS